MLTVQNAELQNYQLQNPRFPQRYSAS